MQSKKPELMNGIIEYINAEFFDSGRVPSIRDIAEALNISKSCAGNYVSEMKARGLLEAVDGCRGIRTKAISRLSDVEQVPVLGAISCGTPLLAEENIEGYLTLPRTILGHGKFFILKANGDSMINAGISDGDYVIVRQQETAESGRIVVARIEEETTLKRYLPDNRRKRICLHPENDEMEDMYFKDVDIQGVAIKVIKDL